MKVSSSAYKREDCLFEHVMLMGDIWLLYAIENPRSINQARQGGRKPRGGGGGPLSYAWWLLY